MKESQHLIEASHTILRQINPQLAAQKQQLTAVMTNDLEAMIKIPSSEAYEHFLVTLTLAEGIMYWSDIESRGQNHGADLQRRIESLPKSLQSIDVLKTITDDAVNQFEYRFEGSIFYLGAAHLQYNKFKSILGHACVNDIMNLWTPTPRGKSINSLILNPPLSLPELFDPMAYTIRLDAIENKI